MTDFGAFVELAPGVDALLHVSQISLTRTLRVSPTVNTFFGLSTLPHDISEI